MSKSVSTFMRRSIISLSRSFPSFSRQNPPLFPPWLLHNTIPLSSQSYSSSPNQKPFPKIEDDAVRSDSREEHSISADVDFDEVSKDDLKKRIGKYLEDDGVEAIPSIFEAILSRKLAGKHDETDEEIIGDLGPRVDVDSEDSDDDDDDELASDSDDDW